MTVVLVTSATNHIGLSTDTKPTDCTAGSTFTELDTGQQFIFDGEAWTDDLRMIYALSQVLQ